jgi:N-acetylglutamate synthase-like GNAT family acetyltransferase
MQVISVRESPAYEVRAIKYFQDQWQSVWPVIYKDCISYAVKTTRPLPQWYLLVKDGQIIGCAGLITSDFISRMDLYPWICALYVDENHRGRGYGAVLMDKAKDDARKAGFATVYLSTDPIGYYEKHGFEYIGQGYHPWQEESRIYASALE